MAMKTTSTRDQIIGLLKRKKEMTVSSIANQLDITEMAVRRHLNTLERDDVVHTTLQRQAMGRPTNMYRLSPCGQEMFPRAYDALAIDILRIIQEEDGMMKVKEIIDKRKDKMRTVYEKRMFMKSFEERIYELEKIQNENGYMAEVERMDDGTYLFKEFNCPVAEVAREFSVICNAELELFKELIQTENVKCDSCMTTGQDNHCYYKITQ
ncbi:helix-turn-helix transcriptional regulator [Salisediminibacterium beveridgei]|uniref:Transcriptional regulator, DeoR family n=1 Tax=Salisediminibacterium beveridgei TaxID=632773 RepID=A0A1D7QSR5_9BACI|nr:metalloregulator ArsR/SmtB family transcription factor [Salisediminibacterium beveridgei]AOM82027.1 Transcriptional regulator, DeoR family [Salisediminibacterium beveridgei]